MSRTAIVLGMVVTFGLLISVAFGVGFGFNTYLFQDGSRPLTDNWTTGIFNITSSDHVFAKNLYANATQPLNSKGLSFSTVQGALDDLAGDGWVYVPVGTWSEAVTISDSGVSLFGSGWSSIIDGGTTGHAIFISGVNCRVYDLQVKTDRGGGNPFDGININANYVSLDNIYVSGSDRMGIYTNRHHGTITYCWVDYSDEEGVTLHGLSKFIGNLIDHSGTYGLEIESAGDRTFAIGNVIANTGNDGIRISSAAEGCIVSNNRIVAWTNEAIDDDSGTSLILGNLDADSMIPSNLKIQFRDKQIYLASLDDGHFDVEADISIDLNAPVSIDGNLDMNLNYVLYSTRETWMHFDTVGGAAAEHVFCIPSGITSQDKHYARLVVCLDSGAGADKWLNVTLNDGTNFMWVNMTGATTEGSTTVGAFDLDVSAENLNIDQFHSAGGAVSHINILVEWYYKENE